MPDPLGRITVPRDLAAVTSVGAEAPAEAAGLTEAQVKRIWAAGRNLYRTGMHPALALCVRRNGEVVLDRAIGHARGNGPRDRAGTPKVLATPETPFCVFSTSKGITALVIHMLAERGFFDIHDRVVDYLPEYGANGKQDTTIAHILAHRAGIPWLPRELANLDSLTDMDAALEVICASRPFARPGTRLAYHAISGGIVLGEIVRRVTGRSIREVLAAEILDPLGFRWGNYGVAPEDVEQVALSYATGPRLLPPVSQLVGHALSAPIETVVEFSNDPRFLTSIIPSATIVSTANELSRFFEIFRCGGTLDGHRVMAPETLRYALTEQSRLELDLTLVIPVRFSYGLMLGAKVVSLYGLDTDLAFGHLGLINIVGWADPERGISAALLTSGKAILYPELRRFYAVMATIAAQTPKLAPAERPF
ncbi:serine hydrolase domain-containing protein [Conexibacter sp. DBS9H8]|uniref:serine hydrolase domain-containing protein n=1 Tax=Conexibacter sp. DBS9H8 TaxID=2937801 RepID=UPI003530C92C